MVIFTHGLGANHTRLAFGRFANIATHGVAIFFVLSGFVITSTLLKNEGSAATCIKQFYIKRFFRLLPSTWIYLFALLAIDASLLTRSEILSCIFFFRNSRTYPHYMTQHFWTLSIEEQFYLVWPPILVLLGKRKAGVIAAIGVAAVSMNRFMHWTFYEQNSYRTEANADTLLIGCIAAILLYHPKTSSLIGKWARPAILPASCILAYCSWKFILVPAFESVAIALLLIGSVNAKPMRTPLLVWIGRISYSLYIWNLFFFDLKLPLTWIIPLMLSVSLAGYYLIEKPGTELGRKLANQWEPVPSTLTPAPGRLPPLPAPH